MNHSYTTEFEGIKAERLMVYGELLGAITLSEEQQSKATMLSARGEPQHIGNVRYMRHPQGGHGNEMELAST